MTADHGPTASPALRGRPGWSRRQADECARRFLRDHESPLRRYVSRLIPGDRHRIEDVVQETILRAWQHHEVLTTQAKSRAWLFRVARNLTIDSHRRRSVRPREVMVEVARDSDLIERDQLNDVLQRRLLADVLAVLSPEHREVLVYLYYFGMTQVEVARVLGIAQGTVKSRAHYALSEARQLMIDRDMLSA